MVMNLLSLRVTSASGSVQIAVFESANWLEGAVGCSVFGLT